MCLYRPRADVEASGDTFATIALGDQLHDFTLARGEHRSFRRARNTRALAARRITPKQHLGELAPKVGFVGCKRFDGSDQLLIGIGLQYVASRPSLEKVKSTIFV